MLRLIKKNIWLVFLCLALFARPVSAEEIKEFVVLMKIDSEANVHVVEKIIYDFEQQTRYGIYRYLPIKYRNALVGYNLQLEEIDVPEYKFVTSRVGDRLLIKIGEEGKELSGVQFYGINYLVKRAFAYEADRDELSWQVTGNGWPVGIRLARAEIDLPRALPADQVQASCLAGQLGVTSTCASMSLVKNNAGLVTGISFSQKNLQPTEGLTINLSLPKGVIAEPGLMAKMWDLVKDNYIVLLLVLLVIGAGLRWRKLLISKLKFNK